MLLALRGKKTQQLAALLHKTPGYQELFSSAIAVPDALAEHVSLDVLGDEAV